jgi:hypothetical protein
MKEEEVKKIIEQVKLSYPIEVNPFSLYIKTGRWSSISVSLDRIVEINLIPSLTNVYKGIEIVGDTFTIKIFYDQITYKEIEGSIKK